MVAAVTQAAASYGVRQSHVQVARVEQAASGKEIKEHDAEEID
jgi:hypothetical protein